ncbi:MAG: hypothetical protein JO090_12115 [Rhizobacter sp.]|nr:hypothetical protein [Rhizobacter sp.]
MTPTPSGPITFVCCIEHGRLEPQTLLMLKTLRANGGSLSRARVIAVVGRLGAPLGRGTRDELVRLGVELVHDKGGNPAPWFNYSNKVTAVGVAERVADTPLVAWLDSDVLVAAEPAGLLIADDLDFAGRCEYLPPTVRVGDPTYVPYWERLCALAGTTFQRLPIVRIEQPRLDIRLSFNSGVFVWRRGTPFAEAYRSLFVKLLQSRLSTHDGMFFIADQVILSPLLVSVGLRWKHLDVVDHHMTFQGQIEGDIASPDMSGSRVIHYSKSLSDPFRGAFMRRLRAELPALHDVVEREMARHDGAATRLASLFAFSLKAVRAAHWKVHAARLARAPLGR